MGKEISVALAGIGGYGENYVKSLLEGCCGSRFVAAVDPFPEKCKQIAEIKAKGIPIFPDLESMYKQFKPDLMALSSPIQLHKPQAEYALSQGSSVICEKPVAGSLADAEAMLKAEAAHPSLFLAIGYQWSFSKAVLDLRADIKAGKLGRPLRLRSLILWPRPLSYYKRNSWAGALKTPRGDAVNDSPLNNATAHYLHNCLFVLDAKPESLQAELCRANKIENFDAVALRCFAGGAEILFYSAHTTRLNMGPVCSYEFENAVVSYESCRKSFTTKFKDDSVKVYGNPEDKVMKKLEDCVQAAREGFKPVCRVEQAMGQTRCMEAAQASCPVVEAPASEVEVLENGGDPLTTIKGLPELFSLCFAQGSLPSESGLAPWLKSGRKLSV